MWACTHLAIDRVRRSDYTTPSIESSVDASLGDGDCLLLHNFMDGNTVDVGHFIEFVDADNATVSKDHRASFESPLARVLVGSHCGR